VRVSYSPEWPGQSYYLAIETKDSAGCYSDLSDVVMVLARPDGVGICLENTDIQLGEMKAGAVAVSSSALVVTNTGGVPVTLKVSLKEPAGWKVVYHRYRI